MDFSTDQAVENAALAGAAAVQRLVAERNELRNRLAAQEHEAAAYRAANTDLRKRLILIHRHYVDLAKRVVGDLERVDGTIREIAQEAHQAQEAHPAKEVRPQEARPKEVRLQDAGQAQAQDARSAGKAPAHDVSAAHQQQPAQDAQALHWVEAASEATVSQSDEIAAQRRLNGSAQSKA